jgi:hypothetical protein
MLDLTTWTRQAVGVKTQLKIANHWELAHVKNAPLGMNATPVLLLTMLQPFTIQKLAACLTLILMMMALETASTRTITVLLANLLESTAPSERTLCKTEHQTLTIVCLFFLDTTVQKKQLRLLVLTGELLNVKKANTALEVVMME